MAEKITLESVVRKLVSVRDHGRYVSATCVFHSPDNHPSMLVYPDGFICLGCGAKGSISKLQKQLNGWMPPANVGASKPTVHLLPTDLYELNEVYRTAHQTLLKFDDPLGLYLKNRGLHGRIVPQKLGYLDGWYIIPVFDEHKQLLGVVARAGQHVQDSTGARFNIPRGQQTLVYVPDYNIMESNDYLVVVYGMLDALSLCELGIPVCTPTSGKDSLHPKHLDKYRKRIIIIPDKNEEDTAIRLRDGLGWRGDVLILDYPDNTKDPNDLLVKGYGVWLKEELEKRG